MSDLNSLYQSEIPQTGVREVAYCPRKDCGCPYIKGYLAEHDKRVHSGPVVAVQGINIRKWEREWR